MLLNGTAETVKNALPPLFDGLIPVLRDDDTIAIHGIDATGVQCDQPLAILDLFTASMLTTTTSRLIERATRP